MTHRNIKIATTTVVLAAAFVGLLWSSLREGTEYYKHVDEVMTDAKAWEGKRLQLHGYAADVRQRPGTLEYRFKVQNKGSVSMPLIPASCPTRSRTMRRSC